MADQQQASSSFKVYARWRPLTAIESSTAGFERNTIESETNSSISISSHVNTNRTRTWKSDASFTKVFPETAANSDIFAGVVAPTVPRVMQGATCNLFAYGHSGSGKTHTIIGYNYDDSNQLGLCLGAARRLFEALDQVRTQPVEETREREDLGVAVRLYEVRGKHAYDLLNNNIECYIREGPDGQTHVRGQTETLEDGKVRVRPIVARPCWCYEEVQEAVRTGLKGRTTGSSSIHDESSRTHAVIELEVVTRRLMDAREEVTARESELVPVGKRATDVYIEEQSKSIIKTPEGKYIPNPGHPVNQAIIDAAEAEKAEYENRLRMAEDSVKACFDSPQNACLGGKFIFVDLAGSEYFDAATSTSTSRPKQTTQEQRQGRQINTDLFALKEVIRAKASKQSRIPFRASPLTMILRSHFLAEEREGQSAMILTLSPEEEQFVATLNTLKYGNLVGEAGRR
ncbi:kinesin family protein [Aaosphaeria arxii CBS 175.79]|uniref:Kinesin-like protein n=1 Tax=Aaosphaeria arxii CBS 175.79 TaxID=1450172 RepID=A0A6A5XTS1_9PLEO|nr:kinesin family protein [Aaosphaeria arxii CBS 175.79]KAF2016755.1 kinesin family protein [Aaosphaeria arxii CBS 175.79]